MKPFHKIPNPFLLSLLLLLPACGHPSFEKLIGGEYDEHGCLGAAGYTWSYALHDCVRLWEVGQRFQAGPQDIFLVFSADSLFAEILPPNGKSVICKRTLRTPKERQANPEEAYTWKASHHRRETVSIKNGVINVLYNNYNYTLTIPHPTTPVPPPLPEAPTPLPETPTPLPEAPIPAGPLP